MSIAGYKDTSGRWLAKPSEPLTPGGFPAALFIREEVLLSALAKYLPRDVERVTSRVVRVSSDPLTDRGLASVALADGTVICADLCVGADGAFSEVRRCLDPSFALKRRGYDIYRGIAPTMMEDGASFQSWGVGSRFAAVPLPDGTAWFATVPSASPLGSSDARSLSHEEHLLRAQSAKAMLRQKFSGWHRPVEGLLDATPADALLWQEAWASDSFSAAESPVTASAREVLSRVALIGDAARTLDPVLAQGAGVAIEDG